MLELMSHMSRSFTNHTNKDSRINYFSLTIIVICIKIMVYLPLHKYLTVPSTEALAMLVPEAEKRHLLIGLVCPKNVS